MRVPPPRTAHPVTTMNTTIPILMTPTTFMTLTPSFGVNPCMSATKTIAAPATPRDVCSETVVSAARIILEANVIHPVAIRQSVTIRTVGTGTNLRSLEVRTEWRIGYWSYVEVCDMKLQDRPFRHHFEGSCIRIRAIRRGLPWIWRIQLPT